MVPRSGGRAARLNEDNLATEAARTSISASMTTMGIPFRVEMFAGAHHLDAPLLTTLLAQLPRLEL